MEINSQASLPPESPTLNHELGNSEIILRLLTEIRDAQRQSLDMAREAMLKQRQARRMAIPMMIFAFVIVAAMPLFTFYSVLSRRPTVAPLPNLRPPIVAPR